MRSRLILPAAAFAQFLLVPSRGWAQHTILGPSFALMGGREGMGGGCGDHRAPYVVGGISFPFVDGSTHRFSIHFDYYSLRLTNDRFQRTYQNGFRVAEQRIASVHHWTQALSLGMRWGFRM